jgi:hypothetical protein
MLLLAVTSNSQEIRSFQDNGLYGFIQNKDIVIEAEYNYAFEFKDGLALVKKDNLWGFIDGNNATVIPFTYDRCSEFSEGFALVIKDGKSGIVDIKGNIIVPAECSDVKVLKNGFCTGKSGNYALFMGGDRLTSYSYESLKAMSNGYFHFKLNGKYGVLDSLGNELISARFITTPYCYESRIESEGVYFAGSITDSGDRSYFNSSGELTLNGEEYETDRIHYPTIYAGSKDGKTLVVNIATGEVLLPLSDLNHMDISWRPCDGYGYSGTAQLYFEKDSSYTIVALNKPKNRIETNQLPLIFEEFLMVPKSDGLFDIYSQDLDLLQSGVHAIVDKLNSYNSEFRICSISDRSLLIWKEGNFAQWNPSTQTVDLVSSAALDSNVLFNPDYSAFRDDSQISMIGFDDKNLLFEVTTGDMIQIYLYKDLYIFWNMIEVEANQKVKLKKFQYDEYDEDNEHYIELYNVVLKIGGKKEHFGW